MTDYKFIFALAVFLVAALTTSQSTATNTIVPIGLAAGLSPALVSGMWAGGLEGVYTLPANGTQIAAVNFDAVRDDEAGHEAAGPLVLRPDAGDGGDLRRDRRRDRGDLLLIDVRESRRALRRA